MLLDRCLFVLSVMLVYCGQTVGWIKMKLGMETGLGPDHIVRWGPRSPPPKKGTAPPICGPCLCGQTAGLEVKKGRYHNTNYVSILYVFNLSSNLW